MSRTYRRKNTNYKRSWLVESKYMGYHQNAWWYNKQYTEEEKRINLKIDIALYHSDSYCKDFSGARIKEGVNPVNRANLKQQIYKAMKEDDYNNIYINNKIRTIGASWWYD